jgi:DNA repair photolyase
MPHLPAVRVVALRVSPRRNTRRPEPVGLQPAVVLDERLRGTRFVTLRPRTVLNPPAQTGMPFWSLNPYVGCEFGCTYCYARYAHRYVVERAHAAGTLSDAQVADFRGPGGWEAFETRIFVKTQILDALEADLRRYFRRAGSEAATIVIGTATDPYQPAERRFRLTRAVLERLARCEGLSLGLITKSALVTRDVDLFLRIQRCNDLEIHLSLAALDADLIRVLEARSPLPAVRLRALERLTQAGPPGDHRRSRSARCIVRGGATERGPVRPRQPVAPLSRDPRPVSAGARRELPAPRHPLPSRLRGAGSSAARVRPGAGPPHSVAATQAWIRRAWHAGAVREAASDDPMGARPSQGVGPEPN